MSETLKTPKNKTRKSKSFLVLLGCTALLAGSVYLKQTSFNAEATVIPFSAPLMVETASL